MCIDLFSWVFFPPHLSSLLFLFPLLFILQPFLLLARDNFGEAVIVGAGLRVLRRGDLRVVVDDHNTYSKRNIQPIMLSLKNSCNPLILGEYKSNKLRL